MEIQEILSPKEMELAFYMYLGIKKGKTDEFDILGEDRTRNMAIMNSNGLDFGERYKEGMSPEEFYQQLIPPPVPAKLIRLSQLINQHSSNETIEKPSESPKYKDPRLGRVATPVDYHITCKDSSKFSALIDRYMEDFKAGKLKNTGNYYTYKESYLKTIKVLQDYPEKRGLSFRLSDEVFSTYKVDNSVRFYEVLLTLFEKGIVDIERGERFSDLSYAKVCINIKILKPEALKHQIANEYLGISITTDDRVFYMEKEILFPKRNSHEFKLLKILVEKKGETLTTKEVIKYLGYGYNRNKKLDSAYIWQSAARRNMQKLANCKKRLLGRFTKPNFNIELAGGKVVMR